MDAHLKLAGVTRLSLHGRGPSDAYIFEPHRLALPCWTLALQDGPPALLVTLDRHLDLVPPADPASVPDRSAGLHAVDEYARWSLDVRNVDHILAAMEAGVIEDAIVIARAEPGGALTASSYVDRRGRTHRIVRASRISDVADGFGTTAASAPSAAAATLLNTAARTVLDVDLDCFTTACDADPTTIVPWPRELIRDFLLPGDHEPFWDAVLQRACALTVAMEPYHCGGIIAAHHLLEGAAHVLFCDLLKADLP